MLSYLFLLAAAAATPEMPITDITLQEDKEIRELLTLLSQETDAVKTSIATECTSNHITQTPATQPISITITNAIQPEMLEYKHWTGKYSPEIFTISVNGIEIEPGKTHAMPANTSTVEIGYTYSFMNGMRTGGKKISYQLNENITQANITFNWKDDWRIIVDNGKAVKEIIS